MKISGLSVEEFLKNSAEIKIDSRDVLAVVDPNLSSTDTLTISCCSCGNCVTKWHQVPSAIVESIIWSGTFRVEGGRAYPSAILRFKKEMQSLAKLFRTDERANATASATSATFFTTSVKGSPGSTKFNLYSFGDNSLVEVPANAEFIPTGDGLNFDPPLVLATAFWPNFRKFRLTCRRGNPGPIPGWHDYGYLDIEFVSNYFNSQGCIDVIWNPSPDCKVSFPDHHRKVVTFSNDLVFEMSFSGSAKRCDEVIWP